LKGNLRKDHLPQIQWSVLIDATNFKSKLLKPTSGQTRRFFQHLNPNPKVYLQRNEEKSDLRPKRPSQSENQNIRLFGFSIEANFNFERLNKIPKAFIQSTSFHPKVS
jgi:hypothetical protein